MPIYEYKCNNCGHEFEFIQKINEPPIVECEKCHKNTANRLVSAAGFQLKGTGWYVTDFRDKGKPKPLQDNQQTSGADSAVKSETKESVSKDGNN